MASQFLFKNVVEVDAVVIKNVYFFVMYLVLVLATSGVT